MDGSPPHTGREAEPATPQEQPGEAVQTPRALPKALAFALPLGLCFATYALSGRLGFNPSDEGFILAQAHRIAAGAVPHADLFSPRPLGSALLHLPELALPIPRIEGSRWLALLQFGAIAWLLGAFVLRRPPWRWTVAESLGVASAFVVNLHAYPLMAWHTLDGILLVALAWLALGRWAAPSEAEAASGDRRMAIAAGFALGAALLVKQSFAPAAVLGIAWAATRRGAGTPLAVALAASLPGGAYLLWVASAGGLGALVDQLGGAAPAFGAMFFLSFASAEGLTVGAAALAAGALAGWAGERRAPEDPLRWASAFAVAALIVAVPAAHGLRYGAAWGFPLFWLGVAFTLGRRAAGGTFDPRHVAMLALAWMTSLSWGHPNANLVAGSLAFTFVHEAFRELAPAQRRTRIAGVAALAALALLFAVASTTRRAQPYYDRPAPRLSEALRALSPEFGGIRTSPVTAAYLRAFADCVARYPAARVAVLPDNAILYSLFGLENPFPTDWLFAHEVAGAHPLFVERARTLAREGDYLLLAQSVQAFQLRKRRALPSARESQTWFEANALGRKIAAELGGEAVTCGPFGGFYQPAAGHATR